MKCIMASRELLMEILEELKAILGITDKVKLELRPLKTKAASISLRRKVIRISKYLIPKLDEVSLRYLIFHELVHLKLRTIHHTQDFYKLIHSVFDEETVKRSEERILASLIELNCKHIRCVRNRLSDLF